MNWLLMHWSRRLISPSAAFPFLDYNSSKTAKKRKSCHPSADTDRDKKLQALLTSPLNHRHQDHPSAGSPLLKSPISIISVIWCYYICVKPGMDHPELIQQTKQQQSGLHASIHGCAVPLYGRWSDREPLPGAVGSSQSFLMHYSLWGVNHSSHLPLPGSRCQIQPPPPFNRKSSLPFL